MKPILLLAGGGTGGHIFPALATARYLNVPTLFTGSSFGMERTLVPAAHFPFFGVPMKGFVGVPLWKGFLRAPLLVWSILRTLGLFFPHRPRAVLGFGGYASIPALFWARALKVPYFLHEQNAIPGAATRLFAPKARSVFAAFPSLAVTGTVVITGNPVRGNPRRSRVEERGAAPKGSHFGRQPGVGVSQPSFRGGGASVKSIADRMAPSSGFTGVRTHGNGLACGGSGR